MSNFRYSFIDIRSFNNISNLILHNIRFCGALFIFIFWQLLVKRRMSRQLSIYQSIADKHYIQNRKAWLFSFQSPAQFRQQFLANIHKSQCRIFSADSDLISACRYLWYNQHVQHKWEYTLGRMASWQRAGLLSYVTEGKCCWNGIIVRYAVSRTTSWLAVHYWWQCRRHQHCSQPQSSSQNSPTLVQFLAIFIVSLIEHKEWMEGSGRPWWSSTIVLRWNMCQDNVLGAGSSSKGALPKIWLSWKVDLQGKGICLCGSTGWHSYHLWQGCLVILCFIL